MRTVFANAATVRRDWFLVDATDKTLGRLATEITAQVRGGPHRGRVFHHICRNLVHSRIYAEHFSHRLVASCRRIRMDLYDIDV